MEKRYSFFCQSYLLILVGISTSIVAFSQFVNDGNAAPTSEDVSNIYDKIGERVAQQKKDLKKGGNLGASYISTYTPPNSNGTITQGGTSTTPPLSTVPAGTSTTPPLSTVPAGTSTTPPLSTVPDEGDYYPKPSEDIYIPPVSPRLDGNILPKSTVKLQLQDIASFSCSESEPSTAAKTKSSSNSPVILWKSSIFKDYSPKTRCAQVSARFEAYRKILVEGKTPLFITSGKLNKNPVICLTTQENGSCETGKLPFDGLLFTLAPTQQANATQMIEKLGSLLADIRQGKAAVQPLES